MSVAFAEVGMRHWAIGLDPQHELPAPQWIWKLGEFAIEYFWFFGTAAGHGHSP
jgi:hypothetical protein